VHKRHLIAASKRTMKVNTGARVLEAVFVAFIGAMGLLPLAVHAQAPAPAAEPWASIEAAAIKEGKVAVYHDLNPAGAELLANAFRKDKPGFELEMTRLSSAPLIERFATEFAAGRNISDVVITFPDERMFNCMKQGWMAAWTPPELKAFPATVNYKNQNMMFNIQSTREVLIWNKQKVKAADAPKEWTDLFDPKWKGKVGINPPWRSVVIQGIIAYWEKMGLGDTAAKLKANDVRFFEGSGGVLQAVIRGDVQIAELTDIPLNPALEDGAPVGFVYPKSGTTVAKSYLFVTAKAPHPNAARVFANWLLTAKGQELLQKYGGLSATRPGVPPLSHLPATASLPNTEEGLELTPPAKQKQIIDHWRTVFGVQ
jgi:iron(III) transport system substrate-binding protein